MISRQTKAELLFAVFLLLFLFSGSSCTHYLNVIPPNSHQYEFKMPLDVFFYMDKDLKDKIIYWKLGPSRLHKTAIPIGDLVHKYSILYLREGFRTFRAVDTLTSNPGLLIRIASINISSVEMSSIPSRNETSYNITLAIRIENSKSKEVFKEIYHRTSSLSLSQGTAIIRESVQQSLHFQLEKLLLQLMDDIQNNYKAWEL